MHWCLDPAGTWAEVRSAAAHTHYIHNMYKGDIMLRRITKIIISIVVVAFSFYYTNEVVGYLREKDPLMSEIKKTQI